MVPRPLQPPQKSITLIPVYLPDFFIFYKNLNEILFLLSIPIQMPIIENGPVIKKL